MKRMRRKRKFIWKSAAVALALTVGLSEPTCTWAAAAEVPARIVSEESISGKGYSFDETTGTLSVTSEFDWQGDYPWERDDMEIIEIDPEKILEAQVDVSGLASLSDGEEDVLYIRNICWSWSHLQSITFKGEAACKMDLSDLFSYFFELTSVDLSGFAGAKIVDVENMFSHCSSLESIDVSMLDTSEATSMEFMFDGCSSLAVLDVSSFDTKSVTDMRWMFDNCNKLSQIDLGNFDFGKIAVESEVDPDTGETETRNSMQDMFGQADELQTIKVPENLPYAVDFPYSFTLYDGLWKDENNVVCEEIKAGLSVPMTYHLDSGDGEDLDPDPTPEPDPTPDPNAKVIAEGDF